jgi:hypothetical protein
MGFHSRQYQASKRDRRGSGARKPVGFAGLSNLTAPARKKSKTYL